MPTHRKLFRFRVLLTLSLVYGCSPSQQTSLSLPSAQASSSATTGVLPTPSPSIEPEIKVLSTQEIEQVKNSGIVQANNQFGWQLFSEIYKAQPDKNHFISPLSATLALQMTLQGADGTTLQQMKHVLGLSEISEQTLNQQIPLLMRKLRRPAEDITLEIANSLWASTQFEFLPDFITAVKNSFAAEVSNVDFLKLETIPKINQWTQQATHGKIEEIIKPLQNEEELRANYQYTLGFLINAIYFNANWHYPFDKSETREKDFKLENQSTKQIPMMRLFATLPYLTPTESFPHQGIALPYGKEGKLSMYIFLPSEGKTLKDLQQDLTTQGFESIRPQFYYEGGSLELPRFKLKWNQRMNKALSSLGITDAFNPKEANLLKMAQPRNANENFYLSYVEQFTYLDIHEEGTEAAAVTVVAASSTPSSEPQRSHSMIVDHPFVFLIQDNETGQILFMGSITDPTLES